MADLIFLFLVVGFFAGCAAYVRGLDRMIRGAETAEVAADYADESAQ